MRLNANPDHPDIEHPPSEDPPIPHGFVRPLTDPVEVARWFALNEPPEVLTEFDPFSPEWLER